MWQGNFAGAVRRAEKQARAVTMFTSLVPTAVSGPWLYLGCMKRLTWTIIRHIYTYTNSTAHVPPRRRSQAPDPACQGTLNPRADDVRDPAFVDSEFFDPRDLVQVKYEMLR